MEKFKNREIDPTKKVLIYRNLNRKGRYFSIKQDGLVVAHTKRFYLTDVECVVNKSGKKRALETRQRNVHAYLKGTLSNSDSVKLEFSYILNYKPFNREGFYSESLGNIDKCSTAYIEGDKILIQI